VILFKKQIFYYFLVALILTGISCNKIDVPNTSIEAILNLPEEPYDYSKEIGDIFINNDRLKFDIQGNRQIELGRVLFYDKRLSIDNTTSCATCHIQKYAFADNVPLSKNFNNNFTNRNTLPVFNYFWRQSNSLWEGNGYGINLYSYYYYSQSDPLKEHVSMGIDDFEYLKNKLLLIEYYNDLFEEVYAENITERNILNSRNLFLNSLISSESKYDEAYEKNFQNFSALEKRGLKLYFKAGCNGCHNLEVDQQLLLSIFDASELFNEYDNNKTLGQKGENFANNGLGLVYDDEGAGNGKFRIPNLRNITLTAPYMHDGRFNTLDEVIEHYDTNIKPHPNLDDRLTGIANFYEKATPNTNYGAPIRFNFSLDEKAALITFLNTLTDSTLITSPLYSDPFIE